MHWKSRKNFRAYSGIESGLRYTNRNYIAIDRDEAKKAAFIVTTVVDWILMELIIECPPLKYLEMKKIGSGSYWEGLKITTPEEFDVDVVFTLPDITKPTLTNNNINPGYVNLQLLDFERLKYENSKLHDILEPLVDDNNYLRNDKFKSFMQSVLDKAISNIRNGKLIKILGQVFTISRKTAGPALTLTVEGEYIFEISIDLVPCVLIKNQWPKRGFRKNNLNPDFDEDSIFLIPKKPKNPNESRMAVENFWRLSFQLQERDFLHDRQWLKPTIRIFKRIRDHFGHKVSSYAIKTIFLWELELDNIPDLWNNKPFSFCVVYMLKKYAGYLKNQKIPYFWNKNLCLLKSELANSQIETYYNDIQDMIEEIVENPTEETILGYLSTTKDINYYKF